MLQRGDHLIFNIHDRTLSVRHTSSSVNFNQEEWSMSIERDSNLVKWSNGDDKLLVANLTDRPSFDFISAYAIANLLAEAIPASRAIPESETDSLIIFRLD